MRSQGATMLAGPSNEGFPDLPMAARETRDEVRARHEEKARRRASSSPWGGVKILTKRELMAAVAPRTSAERIPAGRTPRPRPVSGRAPAAQRGPVIDHAGIVRDYVEDGRSLQRIAAARGHSVRTVREVLADTPGVTIAPTGTVYKGSTSGEIARVRDLYLTQEMTVKEVACELGVSTSVVARIMRDGEVPARRATRRQCSAVRPATPRTANPIDAALAVEQYTGGMRLDKVALGMHVSPARLKAVLLAQGVTLRVQGQAPLPFDEAQVHADYAAGAKIMHLATEHHVSTRRIRETLRTAGFEISPRPLPQIDAEGIVAQYTAGLTAHTIARARGHSTATVYRVLRAVEGLVLRDDRAGHSGRGQGDITTPDEIDRVRVLYIDEGLTQVQVAARLGLTAKIVQRVMRDGKIPGRPQASEGNNGNRPRHTPVRGGHSPAAVTLVTTTELEAIGRREATRIAGARSAAGEVLTSADMEPAREYFADLNGDEAVSTGRRRQQLAQDTARHQARRQVRRAAR